MKVSAVQTELETGCTPLQPLCRDTCKTIPLLSLSRLRMSQLSLIRCTNNTVEPERLRLRAGSGRKLVPLPQIRPLQEALVARPQVRSHRNTQPRIPG